MPTAAAERPQGSSARIARTVLLVVLGVVILATGCGLYACTALLRDDESDSVIEDTSTLEESRGSSANSLDTEKWYAEGPVETEYVTTIIVIEKSAFEAMDRLKEAYPATSDEDAAAAAEALAAIDVAYSDAQKLEAPAKYEAIHDYFLEGLSLYTEAGAMMSDKSFAELTGGTQEVVAGLLGQASDQFLQMLDAVDALESVWGGE